MCCGWLFMIQSPATGQRRRLVIPFTQKADRYYAPSVPYPSLRLLASLPALLASFFPHPFFSLPLPGYQTWMFSPIFPPQGSHHDLPSPAFLLRKPGSSIHAFANTPVRSTMKNTGRVKCRGFACGGGKPGFWHLCPDCGKRFCPKCVRTSSRHACLPMVPADVAPSEESELLTNKTIGIARCEL